VQRRRIPGVSRYMKQNRNHRAWQKIVRFMACIVVFCTTYALILPAITMEKPTICGQEAHTHEVGCYVQAEAAQEQVTLTCPVLSHSHQAQCSDPEGNLICMWDAVILHQHTDLCYDEAGALICTLEEKKAHTHGDDCFTVTEPHTHGPDCYTVIRGEQTCQLEETQGHTHGAACSEKKLICTLSTEPSHTHVEACWELRLICGQEEAEATSYEEQVEEQTLNCQEDHDHTDECYVLTVSTRTVEVPGHSHVDSCYESVLICGQSDEAHVHDDSECYETVFLCELEETEGHTHTDGCYVITQQLKCTLPEEPQEILTCEEEELVIHTHGEGCFETRTDEDGNEQQVLTCRELQVWEHTHTEDCITRTVISEDPAKLTCTLPESQGHTHGEGCLDENGQTVCGLEESQGHTHNELCYGTWTLTCQLSEHVHDDETCYADLTEEELQQLQAVIEAIDAMPSADEIEEAVAAFAEAEDEEGEETYMTQVKTQVCNAYRLYTDLDEELQQYVSNAEKLLELEYIWSAAILADYDSKLYWINAYDTPDSDSTPTEISGTVMFVNTPVNSYGFEWWLGARVEWQDGYYRVQEVYNKGTGMNKTGKQASSTGFILLFHDGVAEGHPWGLAVGDYVTLDTVVPKAMYDLYGYSSTGYGSVHISKTPPDYTINSAAPTAISNAAHTADFVDMNIYNYNYYVNENWKGNNYYPGFQWPGGAHINYNSSSQHQAITDSSLNIGFPDHWVNRFYVDSISFGDNIVTNHQYAKSKTAFESNSKGDFGKSDEATAVAKLYDASAASSTGKINWLWYDSSNDSISNRPVGWSFGEDYKAIQFKMSNNAPITQGDGISLKYLFPYDLPAGSTNTAGVTKLNSQSVDGLFQLNPVSGMYYYNSHQNHAQYANNTFTLYNQTITPDFLLYPFGNFLPFNDINTQTTQVGAFNYSGGMKTYVDGTVHKLEKWMAEAAIAAGRPDDPFSIYGYSSRYQLGIMLNEYAEGWHNADKTGTAWNNLSAGGAMADFFGGTEGPEGNQASFPPEMLDNLYNIDWDQPTDFFFGMDMSMNFLMPRDALTGKDNGNNNEAWTVRPDGTFVRGGQPDGIPDYPMVFNFAGDDDVWVYIDGILFLDLTGIHRHVGGTIDFETGMVYYFAMETAIGDTSNNTASANPYYAETFAEIINRSFYAGSAEEVAQRDAMLALLRPVTDANGNQRYYNNDTSRPMKTFDDYTTHTFKFFYMERGSGSSVCRINFNFPMLRENSINVTKENATLEGGQLGDEVLGNPDYYFNIMQGNNLFVGPESVTGVNTYKIMNSDGTFVTDASGAEAVYTTDPYGIFTIKAGQTAVFEGIPEDSGTYYVQELIKAEDNEQYPSVYINLIEDVTQNDVTYPAGSVIPTRVNALIEWQYREYFKGETANNAGPYGFKWYGRSGYDTDAGKRASFYFEQQNRVDTAKLGKLTIQKLLTEGSMVPEGTVFHMHVSLDGEPLPVGTRYKVGTENRQVTQPGIISLAPGETAQIENIISGTRFEVYETTGSAEGYVVSPSFTVTDQATNEGINSSEIQVTETGVQGILRVGTNVAVTITNTRIPQEITISVVKELTSTTDVDMVGNPEFSFQIMKGDANGDRTDAALYGAGVSYKVYDAATGELLRGNEVTGDYGIFIIKAGERAEFTGISENIGYYYIREVLEKKFISQYNGYYVDGIVAEVVDIPNFPTYQGVVSTVKNPYHGNTTFAFNNQTKTDKLSYLTITKIVEGVNAETAKTMEFDMMVELNGTLNGTEGWTPIPVGTPYTLYDTAAFIASNGTNKVKIANQPDRVVTTEGIVTVPGGATAEIDYMIPGTTWRVYETSGSAEGYSVGYGEFWGEDWITAYVDRVEGTIPVYNASNPDTAHVCMTVTNALPSTKVEFSVYKRMVNGNLDTNPHTVNFTAKCITATAKNGASVNALLGTGTQSRVTISGNEWNKVNFIIGYDYYKQFDGHVAADNWPVRLIYEIVELPSEDLEYTHDTTKYYVAVDVNLKRAGSGWQFTATLVTPVPVDENSKAPDSGYATFENQLLGDLTLEKQVAGGPVTQEKDSFNFTVQIGTNTTTPLKDWTVQVVRNGEPAGTKTTDDSGIINLEGIKHGDKVQLQGIPLGCVWRITETNADGYQVSWTVNGTPGSGNSVSGNIPAGGMEVICTNTSTYELPETGRAGTNSYTMAGLALMLLSMAYLMYRPKSRGRGSY